MAAHNRWLKWKMNRGLAHHGRSGGALEPQGILATSLYWVYFKWLKTPSSVPFTEKPEGGKIFHVSVGGSIGAVGKTNED